LRASKSGKRDCNGRGAGTDKTAIQTQPSDQKVYHHRGSAYLSHGQSGATSGIGTPFSPFDKSKSPRRAHVQLRFPGLKLLPVELEILGREAEWIFSQAFQQRPGLDAHQHAIVTRIIQVLEFIRFASLL